MAWLNSIESAEKPGGHSCILQTDHSGCGDAVDSCYEDTQGRFWVCNAEYASTVHFCPVCGMKAPTSPTLPHTRR